MREIKFKYGYSDGISTFEKAFTLEEIEQGLQFKEISDSPLLRNYKIVYKRQYTGLKDKNGVEIYEYMEIDNTYEVSFLNGSYVLTNISNGDIMLLSNYMENNNGKVEITREYTKV